MEALTHLQTALEYYEMGYSVIPLLPGTKDQPLVKWSEYQDRKATKEEITEWWKKYPKANIAIVTGKISGFCVVDHDRYKPEYSEEESLVYFPDHTTTPMSTSPRGGLHMYYLWPNEHISGSSNAGGLKAVDFRCDGNYIVAPPSANGSGGKYAWLMDLRTTPLMPLPEAYIKKIKSTSSIYKNILNKGGCSELAPIDATHGNNYYKILQSGSRNEDLFHIANCLIKGGGTKSVASQVIKILSHNCHPPKPDNEIPTIIESAIKRTEKRERNLADEVREYILLQEGYFLTTDIQQTLQITTKDEKKNLTVILTRLKSEGTIESYGERRGSYRLVSSTANRMTFISEPVDEFKIKLPFGIGEVCKLYAKNIVVIAGTKSAGKTAVLFRIAIDNRETIPVTYLNSEMGDEEFSQRIKDFGIKCESDIKIDFFNCHKNFHDYINGDKRIYMVDFMEIHEDFAQIASGIRKIHEKLKDGICFIAIQKKFGAAMGRGAEFSMEKARLYINLDFQPGDACTKLTLTDVKTPRYNFDDHPRGKHKRIKIQSGSLLTSLDKDWKR